MEELAASDLGTLEYWEKTYSLEIDNFEDHGDVGEIWFCDSAKLVKFIVTKLNLSTEKDKIIDIGCGNGATLIEFAKAGFRRLTGCDYSEKAIELSRRVLNKEGFTDVELRVFDVLESPISDFKFKLAHDKGTYDAISLNPDDSKGKRELYIKNVHTILEDSGYLVLTSCNWTKDELIDHFEEYFDFAYELPSKSFSFSGQKGNTITQLIFTKKDKR